jgi:hypothetical protein
MARALHNCHHQSLDAARVYFSSDNTGEHGEYSRRWVIYTWQSDDCITLFESVVCMAALYIINAAVQLVQ